MERILTDSKIASIGPPWTQDKILIIECNANLSKSNTKTTGFHGKFLQKSRKANEASKGDHSA